MSCCGFQSVIGVGLEEQQLITSNQLFEEILIYSNINSNNLSNLIIYNSNNLSNLLQPQITNTSNLIYKDENLNTIIHLTAQEPFFPVLEGKEIRFNNVNGEYLTKINQEAQLEVYHPLQAIPTGYGEGWWNVHDKLAFIIQEEIGLRFDITNLQLSSGVGTITNEAEATAAALASGAGLVGVGALTAGAGTAIAGGDYGSVALGIAGGALFSVLGYLSYQAQIGCNLSNLGYSNQFSNVNSNMSNANLLLTSNLYSISRAQGFINCNILSQQFVNDLRTNQITLNNKSITSFSLSNIDNFIQTQYGTYYDITNGTLAINSTPTQEDFFRVGGQTTIQGELICEGKIKENNLYLSNVYVNSNLIYDKSYTDNRKYPPKLFTSSSSQSSITYLGQTPIYYETINLNTIDISYGSGTYEIYSSENNTTSISITGTGNNVSNVDDNYSYAFFASNGTFTTNSNLICDILIVGGGGGGGNSGLISWESGGGGAGGVVYMVNKQLNSGTYNIVVGQGGAGDNNGNDSKITDINNNNITIDSITLIGKGGGKGATNGGIGSDGGSGGGGTHLRTNGGLATQGNTFWNGSSYVAGGFNGARPDSGSRGGGGGGAGEIGDTDGVGFGGDGVQVNITGVNTFYAGGGNTFPNTSTTRSDGGGGIHNAGNGLANTGGGGGGAYGSGGIVVVGGTGGSGVVIIRYLKTANQTKKELFNFITNEVGSEYGSFNYNSTNGSYLSNDRYIKNDYYGDFLVVKLPSQIIINRFRIYSRPSFVERAPSLLRLYGSIDNINWEEIPEGSITTALVVGNYSLGYYEKLVNNQIKSYSYFGIVVNKIIGGNSNANNLNFTEFEIYGKEFVSFVPIYTTSNVLSNTSNTIFNNYSNLNLTTSNNLFNYSSNNSNLFSNLNLTTSNNLFNYSSNNSNFFSNQILITSNNLANYTSNNSNFFSNLNYNSLYSSNSNIYTTSNAVKYIVHNEMPRVNKKSAFFCSTTNLIYPNGSTPYYAYHLYLPDYTATGYIQIGSGSGDTYRIFKIKVFFASMYFQKLVNGMPDIVDYTIYMSNKANAGGDGTIAGINIMARGEPTNPFLDNLIRNNIFLLRNNTSSSSFNFNYLSILTPQTSDLRVFIEDLLN
jgi:hypothetical protein